MTVLNFPVPTQIGETYQANGVVYTWNGTQWTASTTMPSNLDYRYVEVAGDTMTGTLSMGGASALNPDGSITQNYGGSGIASHITLSSASSPGGLKISNTQVGQDYSSLLICSSDGLGGYPETAKITSGGSATFAGTVKSETDVGTWTAIYRDGAAEGYNSGSQTWFLQSDGSAKFAGNTFIGPGTETNTTTTGIVLKPTVSGGSMAIYGDGNAGVKALNVWDGSGEGSVAAINHDGSATFAGTVGIANTTGSVNASGINLDAVGMIDIQKSSTETTDYMRGSVSDGAGGVSRKFSLTQDFKLVLGDNLNSANSNAKITLSAGGQVFMTGLAIGTPSTDAGFLSSGEMVVSSSSRLTKKDIEDISYGIDVVKQLKPRKFKATADDTEHVGFIADEVVSLIPEIVPTGPKSMFTKDASDTEEIPITVNYKALTAVLTKALQESITRIEALEAEVTALKSN